MSAWPTDLSIAEQQAQLRRGETTVVAVTEHFLAQIERRNPELNAVIAINPGALADAAAMDEALASGADTPPMFGVPVLIKDNIETRELPTTAGSLALADNLTGRDAELVTHLRAAGAIVLGKANLSEWANFRSERSSSGWSAVGGQTRNPHDPNRSPCGSSSGSGAAVAAGMAMVAIGTETNGSVVCPASVNGVVGIKPTVGLVSQDGIVPISHSQDTAGPMTRTVADGATLLNAMAGTRIVDPASLDASALEGKRIGVMRSMAGFHEGVDAVFERAIARLAGAGAEVVDDLSLAPYPEFRRDSYNVLLYEFKTDLDTYLASLPGEAGKLTLEKLIAFNEAHANSEMRWFRQEIFVRAQAMGSLESDEYVAALANVQKATREDGIDHILSDHNLDAMIAPTRGPAWTIDEVNGDHGRGGAITGYAAISGYPHITVPMGVLHGLPLGLSFVAGKEADAALIAMAHAFEVNQR